MSEFWIAVAIGSLVLAGFLGAILYHPMCVKKGK